jgi:hypothetical protein
MHAHKHAHKSEKPAAKEMKVGGTTVPNAAYPYLHIVDSARRTMGKGSTQPTMFGVLGRTKMDPYMASLQDLVHETKHSHGPAPTLSDKSVMHHGNTERHVVSAPPKTHTEMHRYGQIQYPGAMM